MSCRECDCDRFVEHKWKKGQCNDCFHPRESHDIPASSPPTSSASPPAALPPAVNLQPLPSVPKESSVPEKPVRALPPPPAKVILPPPSVVQNNLPPPSIDTVSEPLPPAPNTVPTVSSPVTPVPAPQPQTAVESERAEPTTRNTVSMSLVDVFTDPSLLDSFESFLQSQTAHETDGLSMLHFWFACEQYAQATNEDQRIECANEIYDLHFSRVFIPEDIVNEVVECEVLSPLTFARAQDYVFGAMESAYLDSFLCSGFVNFGRRGRAMSKIREPSEFDKKHTAVEKEDVLEFQKIAYTPEFKEYAQSHGYEAHEEFLESCENFSKAMTDLDRKRWANSLFKSHLLPNSAKFVVIPEEIRNNILANQLLTEKTFDSAKVYILSVLESEVFPDYASKLLPAQTQAPSKPTPPPPRGLKKLNKAPLPIPPRPHDRMLTGPSNLMAPVGQLLSAVGVSPPGRPVSSIAVTAKPEMSREELVASIIQTEREFLESMENFSAIFAEPLIFQCSNIITREKAQLLFGHIEPCLQVHRLLLTELENDGTDGSGACFAKLADFFKVYTQYCNNFGDASKLLLKLMEEDLKRKKPELTPFLQQCSAAPEAKGSDILESLVLPMQRVEAYSSLLKSLDAVTAADHNDKPSVQSALTKFTELKNAIRQSERSYLNAQQILEIQKLIEGAVDLVVPGRTLLKEGEILKLSQHGGGFFKKKADDKKEKAGEERYLFLFNDVLVVVKQQRLAKVLGKKYQFKGMFKLDESYIKNIPDSDTLKNAFEFTCNDRVIMFFAKASEIKRKWLKAIESAMQTAAGSAAHMGKRRPHASSISMTAAQEMGQQDVDYKREKYGDVLLKMRARGGIHVEDHKQLLKTYPKTFTGAEAITWMISYLDIQTREEASGLMSELLGDGEIESVGILRSGTFKDDKQSLYRFNEHTNSGADGGGSLAEFDAKQSRMQSLQNLRQGNPKSVQEQKEIAALEERSILREEYNRVKERFGPESTEARAVSSILDAFEFQIEVIMPWMVGVSDG